MADSSQMTDPWAWVPDSWRDAGEVAADKLASTAQTLGLTQPAPAVAPVPPPVVDSIAGAPGAPVQVQPVGVVPAGAPHLPPPIDDSLAGAPASLPLPPPTMNADAVSGAAPAMAPPPMVLAQQPLPPIPPFDDSLAGAPQSLPLPPPQAGPMGPLPPPQPDAAIPPDVLAANAAANAANEPGAEDARLAKMPTEDILVEQARRADAERATLEAAHYKALQASAIAEKQNYENMLAAQKIAQQKQDAIFAEADALSKRPLDPDGRSTFSKIRGVASAFVNGLVAPYMGGRNVGLEMIQKEIDGNVAAQMHDIQNGWKAIEMKRGAVADSFKRSGDMYQAAEAHRLALYKGAIDMVDQQQQQLDPAGSQFGKYEILKRQIRAAAQETAIKQQAEIQKQVLAVVTANREQQKLVQDAKDKQAELAISKQNANTSSYTAQTGRISALNTDANAKDELAFKVKELAAKGDTVGAEQLQKFGIVGVTPDDPSHKGAVLAGNATDTEMGPLRDDVAATRSIVNDIDQIMAIRHGGSTKTGNSAEYQQLKALGGDLLFKLKEANKLKNITDIDIGILEDVKGFDDPTKFRSFKDGILQFRQNTIANANEKLHAHGVPGSIDLPPLPPSVLSQSEQSTDFAAKNPSPIPYIGGVLGLRGASAGINQAQVAAVHNKGDEEYLAANKAEREKIRAQLVELSTNAPSDAVKDEALQALHRIDLADSVPHDAPTYAPPPSSKRTQ